MQVNAAVGSTLFKSLYLEYTSATFKTRKVCSAALLCLHLAPPPPQSRPHACVLPVDAIAFSLRASGDAA